VSIVHSPLCLWRDFNGGHVKDRSAKSQSGMSSLRFWMQQFLKNRFIEVEVSQPLPNQIQRRINSSSLVWIPLMRIFKLKVKSFQRLDESRTQRSSWPRRDSWNRICSSKSLRLPTASQPSIRSWPAGEVMSRKTLQSQAPRCMPLKPLSLLLTHLDLKPTWERIHRDKHSASLFFIIGRYGRHGDNLLQTFLCESPKLLGSSCLCKLMSFCLCR